MPLVVVQYKASRFNEDMLMLQRLVESLPEIVGFALNAPENEDACLSPSDIEVWVQESGRFDVNTKDLEIIIWANLYPERLRNLEQRRDVILQAVRKFLADYDRNLSGFVWVLLQPASFGEF